MIVFERISGPGAQKLMNSYLEVILTIFGSKGCTDRRLELLPKLEKAFLVGLNSMDTTMRARFFRLFDVSLTRNPLGRLHYILSRLDWSHLVEAYWIKHAVSLLICSLDMTADIVLDPASARFPRVVGHELIDVDTEPLSDTMLGARDHWQNDDGMIHQFLRSVRAVLCCGLA